MTLTELINLLNVYSGAIAALFAISTGLWAVFKFREYLKDKRFKTYHELIDELVNEQRQPDRKIKLDRQIAIIYELRNYPSYYSVTKRILRGLKKDGWNSKNPRALEEVDLTLEYISSGRFARMFYNE